MWCYRCAGGLRCCCVRVYMEIDMESDVWLLYEQMNGLLYCCCLKEPQESLKAD